MVKTCLNYRVNSRPSWVSFRKDLFLMYMCECFVWMCVCILHACSDHGGQAAVLCTLGLDLQTVVSRHVGTGN